jgi:hypothetical protein
VRALILIVTTLVIALVSAIVLVPRMEASRETATEQIQTAHGHHHKTVASWTDDTDDDDDDDDDDDVLASTIAVAIAPVVLKPHAEIVLPIIDTLGPATAHDMTLERPPRA